MDYNTGVKWRNLWISICGARSPQQPGESMACKVGKASGPNGDAAAHTDPRFKLGRSHCAPGARRSGRFTSQNRKESSRNRPSSM